jgi:hypothetical protein
MSVKATAVEVGTDPMLVVVNELSRIVGAVLAPVPERAHDVPPCPVPAGEIPMSKPVATGSPEPVKLMVLPTVSTAGVTLRVEPIWKMLSPYWPITGEVMVESELLMLLDESTLGLFTVSTPGGVTVEAPSALKKMSAPPVSSPMM